MTNSKNSPSSIHEPTIPAKAKIGKWKGKNAKQAAAGDSTEGSKEREKDGMSVSDMKKRAALMMEYIAKAQVDMAGEKTPNSLSLSLTAQGGAVQPPDAITNRDFKELSSREMMDTLTRQIMVWQKEHGMTAAVS